MSLTKRKFCLVDFGAEPAVPVFAKTTNAIATAADNQEDYFWVSGKEYFEYIQTGANATIFPGVGATGVGWTLPVDDTDADGIELTKGIVASKSMNFVVGTDAAFFVRAILKVTTRAGLDVLMLGFRKLGAYVDINTPASHLAAYDDKAAVGIDTNAGVLSTHTSLNGSDVDTALAHAAVADGNYLGLEVSVSAAGVVTYKVEAAASIALAESGLAADASAVAFTFDTAEVLVPYIALVATGGGAPGVILEKFVCGHADV